MTMRDEIERQGEKAIAGGSLVRGGQS